MPLDWTESEGGRLYSAAAVIGGISCALSVRLVTTGWRAKTMLATGPTIVLKDLGHSDLDQAKADVVDLTAAALGVEPEASP